MLEIIGDCTRNELEFTPFWTATSRDDWVLSETPGVLDVGEAGRLLGLEWALGDFRVERWRAVDPSLEIDGSTAYLRLDDIVPNQSRSANVLVTLLTSGAELVAVRIARRGDGYELSYPVGNQ